MLFLQPPPLSYLPVPPSSPRPLLNSSRCTFFFFNPQSPIPHPAFSTGRPCVRPSGVHVCTGEGLTFFINTSGPPAPGLLGKGDRAKYFQIYHAFITFMRSFPRPARTKTCLFNVSCTHVVQSHVAEEFRRQTFILCHEACLEHMDPVSADRNMC